MSANFPANLLTANIVQNSSFEHKTQVNAQLSSWVPSGLIAQKGEYIAFLANEGSWNIGWGAVSAEGYSEYADHAAWPPIFSEGRFGALIGKIGNHVFEIGQSRIVQVGDTGQLFFLCNDNPNHPVGYRDNSGTISVKYTKSNTHSYIAQKRVIACHKNWQDTGIFVKAGQQLALHVPAGQSWNIGWGPIDPNGHPTMLDPNAGVPIVPGASFGALVGHIGGMTFLVQAGFSEVTAQNSGYLYFLCNDNRNHDVGYRDNKGSILVECRAL